MASLIDHLIKLTDHRDRDRLELTLSKALIDLLPLQRVVIARVVSEEGIERWLQIATLDARHVAIGQSKSVEQRGGGDAA